MSHLTINTNHARAVRAARWLRPLVDAMIGLAVVAVAAIWWLGPGRHHVGAVIVELSGPPALAGHPLMIRLTVSTVLAMSGYGLWRLRGLLDCFRRAEFFSRVATAHLRAFALGLLLAALLDVLLPPLLQLAARFAGGDHVAALRLQLDGGDALALLLAALFFIIAWILNEARGAVEDSAQIV